VTIQALWGSKIEH